MAADEVKVASSESAAAAPVDKVESNTDAEKTAGEIESKNEAALAEQAEEVDAEEPYAYPVQLSLPTPTHASSFLPVKDENGKVVPPSTTLIVTTSNLDILQELRLQIQDSPNGYWLGPFSFRLPVTETLKKGTVVNRGREGLEVRIGEALPDYLELGEVFGGEAQKGQDKVLEIVREPFSEADARQQVLKLRELLLTGSDAQDPSSVGISSGPSLYEQVRDGLVVSEQPIEAPKVPATNGVSKGAKGKKAPPAKSATPTVPQPANSKLVPSDRYLFKDFEAWPQTSLSTFCPRPAENLIPTPCVKSLQLSPWNPPPPQYRAKGHLLYLSLTTLEGESVQLTCTFRGWFVSRSNTVNFDPTPRPSPKDFFAHSLLDLLHGLSPAFTAAFAPIITREQTGSTPARDILAISPLQQALPAQPWLVSPVPAVTADPVRQQIAYLLTGAVGSEGLEGARDWNDDLQLARELPRSTMQDRVNREKNLARNHAEFTATCLKGCQAIARGDVQPLNPHESAESHMWLHSNIFYTKGVDTVDTYSHLGGDAAAFAAAGKDRVGVQALNRLDAKGICVLGHTIIDWAGERWVCQSFLPGIFRRKEEEEDVEEIVEGEDQESAAVEGGEVPAVKDADEAKEIPPHHLIKYGSDFEASPNVVRWDAEFHKHMEKIADGFHLALHEVTSGDNGETAKVWTSSEIKGLLGTDGRRYILDTFRLNPVDVEFLQKDMDGAAYTAADIHLRSTPLSELKGDEEAVEEGPAAPTYPHRLVLLRQELVDAFWQSEFRKWATEVAAKRQKKVAPAASTSEETSTEVVPAEGEAATGAPASEAGSSDEKKIAGSDATEPAEEEEERVMVQANGDIHVQQPNGEVSITKADPSARFDLRFNPDAFVDTKPIVAKGEEASSDPKAYVPSTITDESDPAIKAVRDASVFLRSAAVPAFVVDVMTGRESAIDGVSLTKSLHRKGINMRYLGMVAANVDYVTKAGSGTEALSQLAAVKIVLLQEMIFRASKHILRSLLKGLLADEWANVISHFLNCLVGTALEASPKPVPNPSPFASADEPAAWTQLTPESLRKQIAKEVESRFRYTVPAEYLVEDLKKAQIVRELASRFAFQLVARDYQFAPAEEGTAEKKIVGKKAKAAAAGRTTTFVPEDVLTLIPVVKIAEPSSSASEETMEAGRITIARGDKLQGLELMQEAVSLFETIHALFHEDVAAAYNTYAVTVQGLYRNAMAERAAAQDPSKDPQQQSQEPVEFAAELALALRFQRQGIFVAERTLGLDHPDTLAYYNTLAVLEHYSEDFDASLKAFRHVVDLWDVVYGPNHPDQLALLTNIGHLLTMGTQFEPATKVFRASRALAVALYGASSVHVAHVDHVLCQALFCAGSLDEAAAAAESASKLFAEKLGAEDATTKEAVQLSEAFKQAQQQTAQRAAAGAGGAQAAQQHALQQEQQRKLLAQQQQQIAQLQAHQQAQQAQQASGARGGRHLTSAELNARAKATAAAEKAAAEAKKIASQGISSRGHLDVEDLVKYVTSDKKSSKKGKKAGRA